MPNSPDVVVDAVEAKLAEHLQRVGQGAPQTAPQSVRAVLSGVTSHQGVFLRGPRADAVDHAVREIARAARGLESSGASTSHVTSLRELSLSGLDLESSSGLEVSSSHALPPPHALSSPLALVSSGDLSVSYGHDDGAGALSQLPGDGMGAPQRRQMV